MAQAALFIGFGRPEGAREPQAVDLLRRLRGFCEERRDAGDLGEVDAVLLVPHGGDLSGFLLVRGSEEQVDRLRRDEEFLRLGARAATVAERFGVVDAWVGDGFEAALGRYEEQAREQLSS